MNNKPVSERQMKKFLAFLDAMDSGGVTAQEFTEAFGLILGVFKELKMHLESELSKGQGEMSNIHAQMMAEMDSMEAKMRKMVERCDLGIVKTAKEVMEKVKAMMPTIPDMEAYEAKMAKMIAEIEAKIPEIKEHVKETPEETRDKLESIKTESEKLDIDAIGYLRDELDKLEKKISKAKGITIFGGGNSGGGRMVKAYDLTSSLNGVLKTFSLPAFWRIISVHSSSFPYVFRPTTDYTSDASAMTITFTSEIEASTTLATGQSLLVIFAE